MTKEQENAISEMKSLYVHSENITYEQKFAIETVLSMLKEKDKEMFIKEHINGSFKLMIKERDKKIVEMSNCIEKLKNKNNELLRKLKNRVKEVKKLTKYSLYKKEFSTLNKQLQKKDKIIEKTLEIAFEYGQIDGGHHKMWVIDQIVRTLTGNKYDEWVKNYNYDAETGEYYSWDKGIAP